MKIYEDDVQTGQFSTSYDAANRPMNYYLLEGIIAARYAYNYQNQRLRKKIVTDFSNYQYHLYDLAGNMIMDANTDGNWAEFVYLGGHRIALLGPAEPRPPSGCGGCVVAEGNSFGTMTINALLILSPAFIILFFACSSNERRNNSILIICVLTGGVVLLSYITTKAQPPDFKIYYYLNDHLDTPQKLVDQNADVVYEAYLEPFGKVAYENNHIITYRNNFRFPGQYHDRESNIYYNWNRYYIPALGRYNRVDQIGIAAGSPSGLAHLFLYCDNNPIIYFDSSGLITVGDSFSPNERKKVEAAFNFLKNNKICNCALEEVFGDTPWNDPYLIEKGDLNFCNETGASGYCCPLFQLGYLTGDIYICDLSGSLNDIAEIIVHEVSHRSYGRADYNYWNETDPRNAYAWGKLCRSADPPSRLLKNRLWA